jgi:type IV pilus assembly protein PilO
MTQARRWTLLALVAILAVLASGWFLLVSPKRSDAQELRDQTASAEQANAQLRAKLQQLKALAPELPKREAEFAAIRRQIPDNPALPDLIRLLTAAGKQTGSTVVSLAPSTPVALVASGAAPTAAGENPSGEQLYQVPLTIKMRGSYSELEDFVGRLEKLRRVLMTTAFTLEPTQDDKAAAGDLDLSLTSRVYMVHAAPQAAAPTAGAGTSTSGSTTTGSDTSTPATSPSPAQ